jgi:hypothetical protein
MNKYQCYICIFIIGVISFSFLDVKQENPFPYDLSKPIALTLPDTLKEISGITQIDSVTVACIQDENGIIFIYSIKERAIKKQIVFHSNGDYEGITRIKDTLYVLRSDGVLFEITNYQSENRKVLSYATGIPASNNEGLCYDFNRKILLIGCKGKIAKGKENKDKRYIYGFDLVKKSLIQTPEYTFNVNNILRTSDNLPQRVNKKTGHSIPALKFQTSAICIHPYTSELYLLCASDHLIFIINKNGEINSVKPLDKLLFNKPEGITFLENGDMLITNEAQGKKANILRFTYKK